MKLITWNCQGAFRKKADIILAQQPDILVVQECEHPDKLIFNENIQAPNDLLWFGDYVHKGLGVFSYGDYRFQLSETHNPAIKIISPIHVTGGQLDFTLFAIWANKGNDHDGRYIGQVWKAVHHYDPLLNRGPIVLTGDFNSNKIWDKHHRIANHSMVVAKLAEKSIVSVYHQFLEKEQGEEDHPTFFLQRNRNKPYHIDYCFVLADLYCKVKDIEIGTYENWIGYSDHAPMIINFEL